MGAQVSSLPECQELIDKLQTLAAKHLELSTTLQKGDLTAVCAKLNLITNAARTKVLSSYEKKKEVIENEILDMKEVLGSDEETIGDYNLFQGIETCRDRHLELLGADNARKLFSHIQVFCDRKHTILVSIAKLGFELKSALSKISGEVGAVAVQDSLPSEVYNEATTLKISDEAFTKVTAELRQLKAAHILAEKEKQVALAISKDNSVLLDEANAEIESVTRALEITNILSRKQLEKEKQDHGKTQSALAKLQKEWRVIEPLLTIGKNARNGFLEMVDRHFENGRLIPLHGRNPENELVNLRNISVHEGDILADHALYRKGYRSASDEPRLEQVYNLKFGSEALRCDMMVRILNMHGTMYKCKAWTLYSHDKRGETSFMLMMTECEAIWITAMALKIATLVEKHAAFSKNIKVLSNITAMEKIKKSFVEKERERQRGSQ